MRTTPAYSVRLLVELSHQPGVLGRFATAVGEVGGNITKLQSLEFNDDRVVREFVVDAESEEHVARICSTLGSMEGFTILEAKDLTFHIHEGGKLDIVGRFPLDDTDMLSMAYSPGVARVSTAIAEDPSLAWEYTGRSNMVAVISDGTAVLGLGDIGPLGAMPVMEGKAMLFKEFANINAVPLIMETGEIDTIVDHIAAFAPSFGGINLEDISAPRCFEIEARLRERLDIPVFHDDQHGTAIVALAALKNAAKVTGRELTTLRMVILGAGAAGTAIARTLLQAGVKDIVMFDSRGALHMGREGLNAEKGWAAKHTNPRQVSGSLSEVIVGADAFIGVSGPNLLNRDQVLTMSEKPIVFALANPTPEIMPDEIADVGGVIATGRSDFPNQINNVLAFPGVFRGALDARATCITEGMQIAAANAIADAVGADLAFDHVVPPVLDRSVAGKVGKAVAEQARKEGVCR